MLTGSYLRSQDAKSRISIPKAVRDTLSQVASLAPPESEPTTEGASHADSAKSQLSVFLTPGTDGSLDMYSPAEFQRLADRIHASSPTSPAGRAYRRLFYAQAERVEIDRQGRMRIPTNLRNLAELDAEIMLVGVGDHMEIWNPQKWNSYLETMQGQFDQIAADALDSPQDR